MELGTYIMVTENISMAYFIKFSHHYVCLYVYPPHTVARQWLGRHVPVAMNANNRRTLGGIISYAFSVCGSVYQSNIAGNRSGNMFRRNEEYLEV
jgi:hypothetical protein